MTRDEIKKAREAMLEGLQQELSEIGKQEAARRAELAEQFGTLRNQARGKHAVQLAELLDAAMELLDEDPPPAPPPAATKAAATPAAAALSEGRPAMKTAGPRPITRTAPAAATTSQLPDADAVFG